MREAMRGYEEKGSMLTSRSKSTRYAESCQMDAVGKWRVLSSRAVCRNTVGWPWSVEDCSPMECRKDSAAAAVNEVGLLIHSLTHDTNSIPNQKITKCIRREKICKQTLIYLNIGEVLPRDSSTKRRTLTIHVIVLICWAVSKCLDR